MPQSNKGGSNRNSSTGKQSGDKLHSSHSEKGKTAQGSQGGQNQKGKEDMGKGKWNDQNGSSGRSRSAADDDE